MQGNKANTKRVATHYFTAVRVIVIVVVVVVVLLLLLLLIIIIINNAVCVNIFCAKGVVSYCVN